MVWTSINKRIQVIFNWFPILVLLLLFKHVTNNLSEPVFHSELENEISPLSKLSAKLEKLFLLSSSEICIPWKCRSSFCVFLLFLFLTNFRNFFSIRAFSSLLLFLKCLKFFFFFCLCLLTITRKSLQLSVEWVHLSCRIQYILFEQRYSVDYLLDSMTLWSESSLLFLL